MTPVSLRGRLIRTIMLPMIAGILLVGTASCYSTYHEAAEIYDAELVHFSKVLVTLARQIDKEEIVNIEGITRHDAYEKYLAFRIWKNGKLFLTSDNVQHFGPMTQAVGFTDRMVGNVHWRFYIEHQGEIIVEVAEENEVRLDLVRHILAGIFLPQLIIIPIIIIIISFGINRGLQPVEFLSQLVRKRKVTQLTPISTGCTPVELLPMVDAINDLMGRVDDAMRIEKNFTNYAAHEMRTPIAALKTQAQVILRTQDFEKQKQLTGALLTTIDRTQRIVEQLLTYARVQHQEALLVHQPIREIVLDEVRYAVPRAIEKHIHVVADAMDPCQAYIQEESLRLVISNLLDNSIKYIPAESTIEIALRCSGTEKTLVIQDNGPGIETQNLPHIFDPFYRVTGNNAPGAGLGLAIVKWACDLQRIRIAVEPGPHGKGIRFTLHFPADEVVS